MRVVTINVNGLKQAAEQGFFDWMLQHNADVVCVQDLRGRTYEFDDERYHPRGYEAFFFDAEDVNDGGVAIYCRKMPKAIVMGFSYALADQQGRFIQADFDKVSVASLLVPDAHAKPDNQPAKDEFLSEFGDHLRKTLRKRRQYLFCGDFQCAGSPLDVAPSYRSAPLPGFLPSERAWFEEIFDEMGYSDAFRQFNQSSGQFTWWPGEDGQQGGNFGLRADYHIATPGMSDAVTYAFIDHSPEFTPHSAVIIDYDWEF